MRDHTDPVKLSADLHESQKKLISRVNRIRGQLAAIDTAIREDHDCNEILQTIAACRGALTGLMGEVIEGHVRYHVLDPARKPSKGQILASEQLLAVIKSYLR